MKKFFILAFVFILLSLPANAAQKIKVSALTPFNSVNPTSKMKVITLERVEFNNGIIFEDGTVVTGDIVDVKQPKRGKLNASFKFRPTEYLYNGEKHVVNDPNFIAKYIEYKEIDKLGVATSAATTAGGLIFHIPLLSEGVSLVKGMWKNQEDNRLKSGVVQVYKDSPLSYVEEGKDVVIEENTMFILKFKSSDIEDLDSHSDTESTEAEDESTSNDETTKTNDTDITEGGKVLSPVPDSVESKVNHIETVNPDDVLKEVELQK